MIWASHLAVGYATARIAGINPVLVAFGAILPDLIEMVPGVNIKHRTISHAFGLHAVLFALFCTIPYIWQAWLGILLHLVCDSLTPAGVPFLFDENQRFNLFGGKIKTGSVAEFGIVGLLVLFSLMIPAGSASGDSAFIRRKWGEAYHRNIIDKREYIENRFKFF